MRDFSRMREIITVLTKYGLGGFVQRIRLGAAGVRAPVCDSDTRPKLADGR